MIKLLPQPSKHLIKSIIGDPQLLQLHSGIDTFDISTWEKDENTLYIIGIDKIAGKLLGMVTLKPFTNLLLEAHIYILPRYWGTGIAMELAKKVYQDVVVPSEYSKMITFSPGESVHARKFLEMFGFVEKCVYDNALNYNGKLTDLHFFEFSEDL